MKNLFGCLGVLLTFPLILVAAILFHGWYLQVIYDIGLVPILGQFGLFLPQLGYWVFVLIHVVMCALTFYFKRYEIQSKAENVKKITATNVNESVDAIGKALSPVLTNILTKLGQLLLLYIAFTICF